MTTEDIYAEGAALHGVTREQFKKCFLQYLYSGKQVRSAQPEDSEDNMGHMKFLEPVAMGDVEELHRKESTYQGSWKKRGGTGAYHVSIRVVDRLQKIVEGQYNCDIFAAIKADPTGVDGSVLAQVRDYRRYLMLIEAEMMSQGIVERPPLGDVEEAPSPPLGGMVGSQLPNGFVLGSKLPDGSVVGCRIGEIDCDCDGDINCKNHPEYIADPFVAKGG